MTLRTLNYGNYGIFLIMGNAGFCPSTVVSLVAEWIYFALFRDNTTHYKTKRLHFFGLKNSATKYRDALRWCSRMVS